MSEQKFVRWKDIRANLDILSLVVTLILFSLGIVAIHSASSFATGTFVSSFALKQLIWGGVSAFVYILIIKLGYKKILSAAVPLFAVVMTVYSFGRLPGMDAKAELGSRTM